MCLGNGAENVDNTSCVLDFGILVATELVARRDAAVLVGSDVSR